ncbi:unnamed protein product [Rotaria socialis]|uniref:AIG1-type G domain-containing protein n=1 Tax=Rotaria socialis TaxID=392032 RepID=A0A817ZPL2_9BILA|nr:unnamed protein product [Rotaria socialis]CAF4875814.1 unnamed protein product [Rotaria socialis]
MNKYFLSESILRELREQQNADRDLYAPVRNEPKRTLLLVGPTRAGKSSICNTLRDSLYQPPKPTMYSVTRNPEPQQINGLRIIDMPGFHDLPVNTTTSSLTNKTILQMLKEQLKTNYPVHHIAFVFNLSTGIKQADIDAMALIKSNLSKFAGRTMLVITYAEELSDKDKSRLIEEFFDHPDVVKHNLRDFFTNEIFFLGCLRYESLQQKYPEVLTKEHQNVIKMRKKFIDKCFEETQPSTQQRSNTGNALWNKSSIFFIFLAFMTLAIAILAAYYKIYPRKLSEVNTTSPTHEFHNNDSQNDTELSQKYMNQEDANNKTELNTNHDNTQNNEHKQPTNIDEPDHNSNNTEIDNPLLRSNSSNAELDIARLGSNSKMDAKTDTTLQIEGNTNISISILNEIKETKRHLDNINSLLNEIKYLDNINSLSNEIEEMKRHLDNLTNSFNKIANSSNKIEHPVETSELTSTKNTS